MTRFKRDQQETWILAINATHARIIRGLMPGEAERPPELDLEAEHHALQDVMADRPGRTFSPGRGGRRSFMEPGSDPLARETLAYLKEVVETLETHRNAGDLRKLIVFADPTTLGHLRAIWKAPLRDLIAHEAAKNIVDLGGDEIVKRATEEVSAL